MIKKIVSFAAIMVCFAGFVACDGEDDDVKTFDNSYPAGIWEVSETGSLNAQDVVVYQTVDPGSCSLDKYDFGTDKTFTITDYTPTGDTCENTVTNGTYALNGSALTYSYTVDGVATERSMTLVASSDETLILSYSDAVTHELVFLKLTKV